MTGHTDAPLVLRFFSVKVGRPEAGCGPEDRPTDRYYVGLLSGAELHGAAHQRLRPVVVGRNRIRFFLKKDLARTPVELVKTTSGRMRVSTPEATALDLVRFYDRLAI